MTIQYSARELGWGAARARAGRACTIIIRALHVKWRGTYRPCATVDIDRDRVGYFSDVT